MILSAQPAYQTQRSIDAIDLAAAAARSRPSAAATSSLELLAAPLHQLGDAIEDLAAVHGRLARPAGQGAARRPDRVANVLARRAHGVGQRRSVGRADDVRAARLGARELAADVQLVRLAHGDARRQPPLAPARVATARATAV